jgi:hypothetical protein
VYKSPSSDQIPEGLNQAVCETFVSVNNKDINPICNKQEWSHKCNGSIIVSVHKNDVKTD